MMDSIAAMATDLSAARLAESYSLAVTKKTMDSQELAGQELTRMLESVPTPAKGEYIDTYA
jgi:hypothetical protein